MKKSRLGKKDKDIFSSTTSSPKKKPATPKPKKVSAKKSAKAKAKAPQTKAPPAVANWSSQENKVTVILSPDHVTFLDKLSLEIRVNTGAKIRRSEIIRALVEACKRSRLPLTHQDSEQAIAGAILKKLA